MTFPVGARQLADGNWLTPGISFEDYGSMQMQHRRPATSERRLETPTWAVNDRMLRELVVVFMEERAGFRKPQVGPRGGAMTLRERLARAQAAVTNQRPRLFETMDKLCREYVTIKTKGLDPNITDDEWNRSKLQPYMVRDDPAAEMVFEPRARIDDEENRKRILAVEIEGIDTYLRITEKGGADVVASIVYLYYRCEMDSVGVGSTLGLKPPHVRQTLWRLHETWNSKLAHKFAVPCAAIQRPPQEDLTSSPLFATL